MKKFFLMATMLLAFGAVNAQCDGKIFKISEGKLLAYDTYGNLKSQITSDVIDSDCNNTTIITVKRDGKVLTYDMYGNLKSQITNDAVKVRFNGDEIIVTKSDGKMYRYDKYGNLRGTL